MRVAQAYVREDRNIELASRDRRRDYLDARLGAQRLQSRSTSRSSCSSSDGRRRDRARRRRARSSHDGTHRPPARSSRSCSTSTSSSRRSSSCRRCSTSGSRRVASMTQDQRAAGDADRRRPTPDAPGRARARCAATIALRRRALLATRAPAARPCAASTSTIAPGETVALVGETGAGQVDDREAGRPLLRRRPPAAVLVDGVAVADLDLAALPPPARLRAPGAVPVLRHRPRQHRLRPARRDRRRGRGGGARGRRARLHRRPARRLPPPGHRAGPVAVGRPAPAPLPGPGAARRPGDPAARRGDRQPRPRHRGAGAAGDGRGRRRPHHAADRAPPADRAHAPTGSSWSTTAAIVETGTHDELLAARGRTRRRGPPSTTRAPSPATDRQATRTSFQISTKRLGELVRAGDERRVVAGDAEHVRPGSLGEAPLQPGPDDRVVLADDVPDRTVVPADRTAPTGGARRISRAQPGDPWRRRDRVDVRVEDRMRQGGVDLHPPVVGRPQGGHDR